MSTRIALPGIIGQPYGNTAGKSASAPDGPIAADVAAVTADTTAIVIRAVSVAADVAAVEAEATDRSSESANTWFNARWWADPTWGTGWWATSPQNLVTADADVGAATSAITLGKELRVSVAADAGATTSASTVPRVRTVSVAADAPVVTAIAFTDGIIATVGAETGAATSTATTSTTHVVSVDATAPSAGAFSAGSVPVTHISTVDATIGSVYSIGLVDNAIGETQKYIARTSRLRQIHRTVMMKGDIGFFHYDFAPWAEDNGAVTNVVWSVESGSIGISNDSFANNETKALITTVVDGKSRIKITATAGNNIYIANIVIMTKEIEIPFTDYVSNL